MKMMLQPFYFISYSPWPIFMSFSMMTFMINLLNYINKNYLSLFMYLSLFISFMILFQWWRDVIRESMYLGFHVNKVLNNLKTSMIFFIISEMFFFLSIFWCYMHMFLSPSIDIGMMWPPKNIVKFDPYGIPLLNTIILLSSGVFITLTHYSLLKMNKNMMLFSMFFTIFLGIIFSYFQFIEYKYSMFTISDSVFGSIFFLSTGFHGFHVMIGIIFLIINFFRMINNNYSLFHHFGFEAASWYWHFVDLIWLLLYLLVYYMVN